MAIHKLHNHETPPYWQLWLGERTAMGAVRWVYDTDDTDEMTIRKRASMLDVQGKTVMVVKAFPDSSNYAV